MPSRNSRGRTLIVASAWSEGVDNAKANKAAQARHPPQLAPLSGGGKPDPWMEGELIVHALCHCSDCRRHAGAPVVGWTMYAEDAVKVTKGQPKVYESSEHGRRHFCTDCGTGLFYVNANILPGIIDIQSATYDDPNAVPAMVHIQTAERLGWMERAHELPSFERYPPQT